MHQGFQLAQPGITFLAGQAFPWSDGSPIDRQATIRNDQVVIKLFDETQAVTCLTGTIGAVKAERPRLYLGITDFTLSAGVFRTEQSFLPWINLSPFSRNWKQVNTCPPLILAANSIDSNSRFSIPGRIMIRSVTASIETVFDPSIPVIDRYQKSLHRVSHGSIAHGESAGIHPDACLSGRRPMVP